MAKSAKSSPKQPTSKSKRQNTTPVGNLRNAVRPNTKTAVLIQMLSDPKGATLDELAEKIGWQRHSIRGAISGTVKKKLGLTVTSETEETRGRVYRIAKGA